MYSRRQTDDDYNFGIQGPVVQKSGYSYPLDKSSTQ